MKKDLLKTAFFALFLICSSASVYGNPQLLPKPNAHYGAKLDLTVSFKKPKQQRVFLRSLVAGALGLGLAFTPHVSFAQDTNTSTLEDLIRSRYPISSAVDTIPIDLDDRPVFEVTAARGEGVSNRNSNSSLFVREKTIENRLNACARHFRKQKIDDNSAIPKIDVGQDSVNRAWVVRCEYEGQDRTIFTVTSLDAREFGEGQVEEYAKILAGKTVEAVLDSYQERTTNYVIRSLLSILEASSVPLVLTFTPGVLKIVDKTLQLTRKMTLDHPSWFDEDGHLKIPVLRKVPLEFKSSLETVYRVGTWISWVGFGAYSASMFPATRPISALLISAGKILGVIPVVKLLDRFGMDSLDYIKHRQIEGYRPPLLDTNRNLKVRHKAFSKQKERYHRTIATHYHFYKHLYRAGLTVASVAGGIYFIGTNPIAILSVGGVMAVPLGLTFADYTKNFFKGFEYVLDPDISLGDVILFPELNVGGLLVKMTPTSFVLESADRRVNVKYSKVDVYENLTINFSRAVVDLPVSSKHDPAIVKAAIFNALAKLYAEEELRSEFFASTADKVEDAVDFVNEESFSEQGFALYRVWFRTLPGSQFKLRRLANEAIHSEFLASGISLATRQYQAEVTSSLKRSSEGLNELRIYDEEKSQIIQTYTQKEMDLYLKGRR